MLTRHVRKVIECVVLVHVHMCIYYFHCKTFIHHVHVHVYMYMYMCMCERY